MHTFSLSNSATMNTVFCWRSPVFITSIGMDLPLKDLLPTVPDNGGIENLPLRMGDKVHVSVFVLAILPFIH